MVYGIAAGDLAKWLGVVAQNNVPGAVQRDIPPLLADYLLTLKCVTRDAHGDLRITDKGRLSLRMEAPNALHKQVDPDEVPVSEASTVDGEPDALEGGDAHAHGQTADQDDLDDPVADDAPRRLRSDE